MKNTQILHIVFDVHNVLFKPNIKKILLIMWHTPSGFFFLGYLFNPNFLRHTFISVRQCGLGHGSFMYLKKHYPFLERYEPLVEALASAQDPLEGTFKIISALYNHYPLHILSNMNVETFLNLKHQYPDYFLPFSTIHHFGPATQWTQKPQLYTYKTLLEVLNSKPETILFIDNSARNVRAAQKMGINALKYTSAKVLEKSLKRLGILIAGDE